MEKIYLKQNVYEALQKRFEYIFAEFDSIYVSFSGGKDSGVLYSLLLDYMAAHRITRTIGLFHEDFEAQYTATAQYVERTFAKAPPFVERYWYCIPVRFRNALSAMEPWRYEWDPNKQYLWIREMPNYPYVYTAETTPFFKPNMTPKDVQKAFNFWYQQTHGGRSVGLLGLRADESLDRYSAIVNKRRAYKGVKWTTMVGKNIYTASPLYDWSVGDVWTAYGWFGYDYSRLYDLLYKAGVPLHEMRVGDPFIEFSADALKQFHIIEPGAWARVVKRVEGANFTNIYGGGTAMGYGQLSLPDGHTWESYAAFLLSTLPDEPQAFFVDKIKRIKHPDWKQICRAILRNDHSGRLLGRANAKRENQEENLAAKKAKYAAFFRGK